MTTTMTASNAACPFDRVANTVGNFLAVHLTDCFDCVPDDDLERTLWCPRGVRLYRLQRDMARARSFMARLCPTPPGRL